MLPAVLFLLQQGSSNLFDTTISASGRYGVNCIDKGGTKGGDNNAVNHLIDIKNKKILATLKGFHAIRNENHGGMEAAYSKDEGMVAILRAGKWTPRNIAVLSTRTGAQANVLPKIVADAKGYCSRHKLSSKFVFDVPGAKFEDGRLKLAIIGQIPKQEEPVIYLGMTYSISSGKKGLNLKLAACQPIAEKAVWGWGK